MDKLTALAIKYGTDKWGKHHYTPVYYELFRDRRNEVKKVLEIGPAEGAGMRMFQEFFPNAVIYGAEIDEKRVDNLLGEFPVYVCDQSSPKDLGDLLERVGFDVDLVVDDGSHNPADQIYTCLTLMPFLKKDVIYVIEDVADKNINNYLQKFDAMVLNLSKRYDDRLIIVRHRNG